MSLPNLTNEFIADSYKGVLHTSNQPVTGAELRQVYDGLGNPTSLKISSETIQIGNLNFPTSGSFGQTLIFNSNGNLEAGSLFPIGSVYFTTTDSSPASFLGGTWTRIAQGRFIAGVGNGSDGVGSRFLSAGNTGGVYMHSLTVEEMPSHSHEGETGTVGANGEFISTGQPTLLDGRKSFNHERKGHTNASGINKALRLDGQVFLQDSGGNQPHENTPPAFGLYVWSRIA